jgi:hypothetical protein
MYPGAIAGRRSRNDSICLDADKKEDTMRTCKTCLVLCLALGWITAPAGAVAAEEGAKTFAEVCTQCHTAKRQPLNKKQLTKEQWKEAIERMVGYGAEVPKAKLPDLLDYLVGMNAAAEDPAKK